MSAIDLVKQHPILTGVSAIVIIGGAFLLFGGTSSGEETGPMTVPFPQGGVNADNANLAAQLQLQTLKVTADNANLQIAAQKEISLADIAKQVTIAQYQKDTAFHVADVTGLTAQKDIAARVSLGLDKQKKDWDLGIRGIDVVKTKNNQTFLLGLDKQKKDWDLGTRVVDLKKTQINNDTKIQLLNIANTYALKRNAQIQAWDLGVRQLQIETTKKR